MSSSQNKIKKNKLLTQDEKRKVGLIKTPKQKLSKYFNYYYLFENIERSKRQDNIKKQNSKNKKQAKLSKQKIPAQKFTSKNQSKIQDKPSAPKVNIANKSTNIISNNRSSAPQPQTKIIKQSLVEKQNPKMRQKQKQILKQKQKQKINAKQNNTDLHLQQKYVIKTQSNQQREIEKRQTFKKKQIQQKDKIKLINTQISAKIGQLPKQLSNLYNQAKSKDIFIDKSFPSNDSSIGTNQKAKTLLSQIIWLRPNDFFKGQYELFNGIQPNDIKQGSLGVCYMLATLASLAQNQQNIRKIFVFHDKEIGFYVLKLLINGVVTHVVVDDLIPCRKSTKQPIFAKPIGNQLWVCLLQKAWAKCVGNYFKAQGMTPDFLMQDLTMAPSFGGYFKDSIQSTKQLNTHLDLNHVVVLSTSKKEQNKNQSSITGNHAYSLLGHYQHQGNHMYKIRDPWGKVQWNGTYGQNSPNWTNQLKEKVGFVDSINGIFCLSQIQLLDKFNYYSICIIKPNYSYDFTKFQTNSKQSIYYRFQLQKDEEINIKIVQPFSQMIDDHDYKYSPVILEVGKITSDGNVQFLTQGDNSCSWGAKSVNADKQIIKKYQKGIYFVRVQVQWVNQKINNTSVFSIYSPSKKNIIQLQQVQGQQLWIKLIKSFAVKQFPTKSSGRMNYIMQWMKGQLVCYGYVKQNEQADQFMAKWKFTPEEFQNCEFGLNYSGGSNLQYKLGKGPQHANIGTLRRISLNKQCSSGTVYISADKL